MVPFEFTYSEQSGDVLLGVGRDGRDGALLAGLVVCGGPGAERFLWQNRGSGCLGKGEKTELGRDDRAKSVVRRREWDAARRRPSRHVEARL